MVRFGILLLFASCTILGTTVAADEKAEVRIDTSRGDQMMADYFQQQTQELTDRCLADINTAEDWNKQKTEYRRQLFEMLGLDPLPERTPLHPVVTGRIEHPEFVVEKLHFQSRPGLYVTGNLYRPRDLKGKVPAILYVCGHGRVKKNGISYGNKVHYQHHGIWFARNGYVCLVIDTLQLGEIEGIHHGTYRYGMWWWNSRGYTPAGVEAWDCIRALDYLQTRDEVDSGRIGVTGRSGGGAYSWWISALDDRIKVAVPVAGITSLKNHVVDGCVEGHCDCMFPVNTYRWDFGQIASLVSPRPLLISNSDKDGIFPLDGVVHVYNQARRIYQLQGQLGHIGLQITEGPHKDTQELRVHAFHWFNRFLKDTDPLIEMTAMPLFEPEQLKVFDTLPTDEINTIIQESFTPKASQPPVPATAAEWEREKLAWQTALSEKCFRAWPRTTNEPFDAQLAFDHTSESLRLTSYDFTSQGAIRLRLYLLTAGQPHSPVDSSLTLRVLDADGWREFLSGMRIPFAEQLKDETLPAANADSLKGYREALTRSPVIAFIAPRGIGPTAWDQSERKQIQNRRRFMLLGQTWHGMQTWDVRRTIQLLRTLDETKPASLRLEATGVMAGIALYASLFEPSIDTLTLHALPASHRDGPIFLNVLRFLDMPQAITMAAERSQLEFDWEESAPWAFAESVAKQLHWPKGRIRVIKRSR